MNRKLIATGASFAALASFLLAHDNIAPKMVVAAPAVTSAGGGSLAFDADGVSLAAWVTIPALDGTAGAGNDCWGYVSGSGREYAIIGTNTSTCFVEITDPGAPVVIASIAGPTSTWRDTKTYQTYAYSVSEGGSGIQVFDLSAIDSGTVTLVNTVLGGGGCGDTTHNVAIDTTSGYLYRCGSGSCGGLVAYDLSTPSNPTWAGMWNTQYVHDAQVVTWDIAGPHFGKEIAFCATGNSGAMHILDVTNKAAMTVIGTVFYSTPAYSHQVWLSDDKQFVYLNDELDESNFGGTTNTRIIDVSDLTAPVQSGTFTSGSTSIDHNLYVDGDLVFEANYSSGLRVFDASTPGAPVQTAYFDTQPGTDAASFSSLWSCYPFFPSGTVIGSDMSMGLFIWRLGDPDICFTYPNGLPSLVEPAGGGTIVVELQEAAPGDLDASTVQMHVDTGSGFVAQPMSQIGGSLQFSGTFPAQACGEEVSFYFSARTVDGITWSDPPAGSTQVHLAEAAAYVATTFQDDVELSAGWSTSATASTGHWEHGDPIGTGAQPEDDHTPDPANACWFTGQGSPGGSIGENDIDNGSVTLISPTFDASGGSDPSISYWRWFSNNQNGVVDDQFIIEISNGGPWVNVETIGPNGLGTMGGWFKHTVRIADYVVPNSTIQLRFTAEDNGSGSIVEAAVDDITIQEVICSVGIAAVNPASGELNGGNDVTITGDGFVAGVTKVFFGENESASVTVLDSSTLVAEVPAASVRNGKRALVRQRVDVRVETGGSSATLPLGYLYEKPLQQAP